MEVKIVVRLNEPMYKKEVFSQNGIKVIEMEFMDGSCPNDVKLSISLKKIIYLRK